MEIKGSTHANPSAAASLVSSVVSASTPRTGNAPEVGGGGESAEVSKPAELLAKLKQLQEQDPTKFKQVMSDIAGKLRTAAQDAGTDNGAALSKLADKFEQAGKTGDLSALQPPPPPAGGSAQAPAVRYAANSGNTANNALQEATETPAQTAKEAASGDAQARRLIARQAAARAGGGHSGGHAVQHWMSTMVNEVNQALQSTATPTPKA